MLAQEAAEDLEDVAEAVYTPSEGGYAQVVPVRSTLQECLWVWRARRKPRFPAPPPPRLRTAAVLGRRHRTMGHLGCMRFHCRGCIQQSRGPSNSSRSRRCMSPPALPPAVKFARPVYSRSLRLRLRLLALLVCGSSNSE